MAGLRIYLAAPWIFKEVAKTVADQFRAAGFNISSRWIDFHGDSDDVKVLEQEAMNDIQDMLNSNGMVVLQLSKSEGKAFEQGFILAASQFTGMNNKIIVVTPDGATGNVFQNLQDAYTLVPTVEGAIEECKKWNGYIQYAELVTEDGNGTVQ